MPLRLLSPTLRRALIATLLVAWALTQTLGAVHRISSLHAAAMSHTLAGTAGHDAGLLHALFAGHHDERDCKAFDQQAHGDLAWGDAAACTESRGVETPVVTQAAGRVDAEPSVYWARGPPGHA